LILIQFKTTTPEIRRVGTSLASLPAAIYLRVMYIGIIYDPT
jgi:hypothetical protein